MGDLKDQGHSQGIQISGSLIARNAVLNLIGQALPLLVAVIAMPFVVRGLGTERFGLLSLAWVVMGYFTIFDLGLGRATTKFVAEALGKGEDAKVPQIIWTAAVTQAIMGLLGTLILFGITDMLVDGVLNIPQQLLGEAKDTFHLLALSIPIMLISGSFSGFLEAIQRFDYINYIKIPTSILTYIFPLVGLYLGFGLPGIVILILIARLGALIVFFWLAFRLVPQLRNYTVSKAHAIRLFSFGGWVMVSNLILPLFSYLDRILIGTLLTMSAVAYYVAPYDIITRLLIIPGSIAGVLFPAFSRLDAYNHREKINVILMRSIKYTLTIMTPIAFVLIVFSKDILIIWLGNDFAEESVNVFRLICIGVLLNAIGYMPFALIQGIGRPDVVAKYHLVEFPIYVCVTVMLINVLGINGAALAWCLRMAWTIPIFTLFCMRIARVSFKSLSENRTNRSIIISALSITTSIVLARYHEASIGITSLLTLALLSVYVAIVWLIIFDDIDKNFAKGFAMQFFNCRLIKGDNINVQR